MALNYKTEREHTRNFFGLLSQGYCEGKTSKSCILFYLYILLVNLCLYFNVQYIVTDPVSSFSTCPIPPSPGTRRRHFSFQPISPKSGALQSPPASPFVSPRSTPVHMLRSRHSSGSALPVHLLPGI